MKKKQLPMTKTSPEIKARLLALFNEYNDSDLLAGLLDPQGTSSFTKAAVEAILAAKENRPNKQFTKFTQIQDLLMKKSIQKQYGDAIEQFFDAIQYAPSISHPVLLLPVRLETRFTSDKLLVRIYPDQISIHSHDKHLTQAEYEAAKTYWLSSAEDPKLAWRVLSSRFGPARASWIARWAEGHDFESSAESLITQKNIRMPQLATLPNEYWVFAYKNGNVTRVKSKHVKQDRTILADSDNLEEGLFDERSKWMHDFNEALDSGFAVEIPLSPVESTHANLENGCDRLVVIGIKRSSPKRGQILLEDLIDAHHYNSGLGFVESGTPTNNTDEVLSSFSSQEDHDRAYEIEIEGTSNWESLNEKELQRTNAHRLATALGISLDHLRYLEGSGSMCDSYTAEMNTVLWTVTGEYYLVHLLSGFLNPERLLQLRLHVRDFVKGGGILPAIRVGRQPYGVLPVTRVSSSSEVEYGWAFWNGDSNAASDFDPILHRIVAKLYDRWLDYAKDHHRVPRVGVPESDPDETLLRILAMEPHSVSYQARPYVDEGFIALLLATLRGYVFGEGSPYEDLGLSPVEWMAKWAEAWDLAQGRIADFLSELSGLEKSAFYDTQENESDIKNHTKPLLKILGWGKGEERPIEMAKDSESDTFPSEYLAEISRFSPFQLNTLAANTLLAHVAQRALKLTREYPGLQDEIRRALCRLSSVPILSFFNSVTDPEQIVQSIKDDPSHHPERKGYGIRRELATQILTKREELGGQFTSIDQLDEIQQLGEDTLQDILYSFREDETHIDIERLFSESLDIASHRVDAWVTSFAAKRLKGIREKEETSSGIYIGAYGFVEDLKPRADKPTSAGYIHAPSAGQAATGAVLYNAFLTHDPKETMDTPELISDINPFHINLTSERVRKAMHILEGIRQGQPLGGLLGFQFERALRDHPRPLQQYIDDFRESFPLVAHKVTPAQNNESAESGADEPVTNEPVSAESVAARNVADGVAMIRDFHGEDGTEGKVQEILGKCEDGHKEHITSILSSLSNSLDAVGDILLNECVYQSVQGNFERAGAVFEAASGNLPPPELESLRTQVPFRSMHCLVGMLFNETLGDSSDHDLPYSPRVAAEPQVAKWFEAVLGSLEDIGIVFEFREEATDTDVISKININSATIDELVKLPYIGNDLAENIIEERSSERGPFDQISDLLRTNGIGDKVLAKVKPDATTGYVERVDINTASEKELQTLPPITEVLASRIKKAREVEPFTCIDDLTRVDDIDKSLIDEIRTKVTTGHNNISLDKCRLSPIDFLYIAQVPMEGGETEIEQRLARFVRDDYGLPADQRILIHADQKGVYRDSLADAIELSRSALDLLSSGTPMSPDTMCHPSEIEVEGYSDTDVANLHDRLVVARECLDEIIDRFDNVKVASKVQLRLHGESDRHLSAGTRVRHRKTDTKWELEHDATSGPDGIADVTASIIFAGPPVKILPSTEWEVIDPEQTAGWESVRSVSETCVDQPEVLAELLGTASLFGIPGAFSPAIDDPHLIDRFENARKVLVSRRKACQGHVADLDGKPNNAKVDLLCKGMKAIFGKSFIVLPTFESNQPEDLYNAFSQDILNSLGEERLRLWLQQLAQVREPLRKFETGLMMIEAWSQDYTPFSLNLAQLPYYEDRNWLGLSIEEGAEAAPDRAWIRSPLSVVIASRGDLPDFSPGARTAGIIIDELIDRIPEPKAATSIAYQYDAPNSQAPQALLLAVSGLMKSDAIWTHEELAAIVYDTIDLAKVRAVDLDALAELPTQPPGEHPEPIGGITPGIYLPADSDQPGWVRNIAMKSIREWINTLEEAPLKCIRSGYLHGPEPTDDNNQDRLKLIDYIGQEWELVPHYEYEMDRFAPGLDYRSQDDTYLLDGAYIKEVIGYVHPNRHRILYRDYKVVYYPDSFVNFARTGKAYWQGAEGASDLIFECDNDGSRHLVLGRLAIELGRLPHSVPIKTLFSYRLHDLIDRTPEYDVVTTIRGHKGPDTNDPVWVDSISATAHYEMTITIPQTLLTPPSWGDSGQIIIKIQIPLLIGEVVEGNHKFGLRGSHFLPGSFYIETSFEYLFESGTYDEDGMRNLLGSRIWVARQFIKEYAWYEIDCSDFLAESMDLDLFDDNAKVLEFDDVPFSYDDILVAKYDWLRKKDFILRCEDYPRGEF